MTITSKTNQHLTEIRRLAAAPARARSGRFAVEGEDLLMAADAAGIPALYVLCARGRADERGAGRTPVHEVEPALLASVCALRSGARAISVFEQRWAERPAGPLAVALWGVRDPGNIGTVIRAATAFGAACVAFGPGWAQPYSPKAVRASMGAIFGTAIARCARVGALPGRVLALVPGAERACGGPS